MKGNVYILQSLKNGRYYIGSTTDIQNRFLEHQQGEVTATKYLRPLKIVFSQGFENIETAKKIEYRLKKLKSRKIIEKILNDGKIKIIGV